MGGGVDNGEQEHRICELPVHPNVLIERKEPDFGPDEAHNRSADGQQDEHAIDTQDQTGSSRYPDRVLQCVETRQADIGRLLPPSIGEDGPVERPEQEMEDEF